MSSKWKRWGILDTCAWLCTLSTHTHACESTYVNMHITISAQMGDWSDPIKIQRFCGGNATMEHCSNQSFHTSKFAKQ